MFTRLVVPGPAGGRANHPSGRGGHRTAADGKPPQKSHSWGIQRPARVVIGDVGHLSRYEADYVRQVIGRVAGGAPVRRLAVAEAGPARRRPAWRFGRPPPAPSRAPGAASRPPRKPVRTGPWSIPPLSSLHFGGSCATGTPMLEMQLGVMVVRMGRSWGFSGTLSTSWFRGGLFNPSDLRPERGLETWPIGRLPGLFMVCGCRNQ